MATYSRLNVLRSSYLRRYSTDNAVLVNWSRDTRRLAGVSGDDSVHRLPAPVLRLHIFDSLLLRFIQVIVRITMKKLFLLALALVFLTNLVFAENATSTPIVISQPTTTPTATPDVSGNNLVGLTVISLTIVSLGYLFLFNNH